MTAPTASDIDKHKLEKIRAVTERILDEIGIRLHNGGIVEMLSKKGFRTEGDIVFFSSTQLQEALDAAPTEFTLHAPNPEWNMVIGGDHAEFAPAYGASSIIDAQGNTGMPCLKIISTLSNSFTRVRISRSTAGFWRSPTTYRPSSPI